ncbi:MAG: methyltransferase [Luteitalea sp.]|nr:methyltransferase [Luteitalea sp.]
MAGLAPWPALRLAFTEPGSPPSTLTDPLLFLLDDFEVRAIDEDGPTWTVFFSTSASRDAARAALEDASWRPTLDVELLDVPDDDWARRTQRELTSVRVDDIIVAPPWEAAGKRGLSPFRRCKSPKRWLSPFSQPVVIIIEPSMGFGTGHHETTRLCLRALQRLPLAQRSVLDVGTGSGVLAIAAAMLGAARVVAIDPDEDAVRAARDNVARNRVGDHVVACQAALGDPSLGQASVVIANLTGALLRREAAKAERLVEAGGTLILSGFTSAEAPLVADAYSHVRLEAQLEEHDWAALIFTHR